MPDVIQLDPYFNENFSALLGKSVTEGNVIEFCNQAVSHYQYVYQNTIRPMKKTDGAAAVDAMSTIVKNLALALEKISDLQTKEAQICKGKIKLLSVYIQGILKETNLVTVTSNSVSNGNGSAVVSNSNSNANGNSSHNSATSNGNGNAVINNNSSSDHNANTGGKVWALGEKRATTCVNLATSFWQLTPPKQADIDTAIKNHDKERHQSNGKVFDSYKI